MKVKKFGAAGIILALLIFSSYTLYNESDKDKILMQLIIEGLNANHFQPQNINDEFSQQAFDLYLEKLDFGKRYFTQIDVENMGTYRSAIDDEIKQGSYELFELSMQLYLKRVEEAEAYCEKILSKPFDFSKEEYFNSDSEELPYAKDKKALEARWHSLLKYQTLSRYTDMIEKQEKEEGEEKKSEVELEEKARERVLKMHRERFHRMAKYNDNDYRAIFINTLTNIYDPHTTYFPPKDKEDFDIRLSGELEGIGALLGERDGYIRVSEIMPGSPSARQGDLEVGDLIIKVAQGEELPVDVVDMRIDDAVRLIRGSKGTEVRLTVKKVDGTETIIPIIRDVVKLEESYAKSAVFEEKGEKGQVGYIYLPSFYSNWQRPDGRSCAKDVAKEIEKLKAENVKGIILDLRNNGGGSLQDVIDMTGLFIEKGPVVQVKSRNGMPYVLDDRDPQIQYEGSLVVMVNSFSASASEILAAAIQDYGRGIILGSPSTFGKGTVQRVFDLDNFFRGNEGIKPLGALKMTTQKFYRINGGTNQLKGVESDIVLPDNYLYLEMTEKNQDFALPWDEITAADYKKWEYFNTNTLRANSQARVAANPIFQKIEENAQRLKRLQDDDRISLEIESYREHEEQLQTEAKKYNNLTQEIESFKVASLLSDREFIASDEIRKETWEKWLVNLQKDPYLFEALQVIQDMKYRSITATDNAGSQH